MNEKDIIKKLDIMWWDKFSNMPIADNLESECHEIIVASFPKTECAVMYASALEYIGWLDSIPVISY